MVIFGTSAALSRFGRAGVRAADYMQSGVGVLVCGGVFMSGDRVEEKRANVGGFGAGLVVVWAMCGAGCDDASLGGVVDVGADVLEDDTGSRSIDATASTADIFVSADDFGDFVPRRGPERLIHRPIHRLIHRGRAFNRHGSLAAGCVRHGGRYGGGHLSTGSRSKRGLDLLGNFFARVQTIAHLQMRCVWLRRLDIQTANVRRVATCIAQTKREIAGRFV